MNSGHVPSAAFTSSSTLPALRRACRDIGLPSEGAKLLRIGENAIWQLDGVPVVARIARTAKRMQRVEKELCIARWLASEGVAAIGVYENIARQPRVVDGHPVTFWWSADGNGPQPSHADLARLLKEFHSLADCPCSLPAFDPLSTARRRAKESRSAPEADRSFLLNVCDEMEEALARLSFALPCGAIHGDAHTRNLLADRGQVVLLDFEAAATGPREWDLLPTAVAVNRYGLPEEEYQAFSEVYGFDVRRWQGYPVLRRVRELTMTTWIMQNAGNSEKIAMEFKRRVASLRDREFDRDWTFF